MAKLALPTTQIQQTINSLQSLCKAKGLGGIYISSFDSYLSEYVPMYDCMRFYVTNFTGSVADVYLPATGKCRLYVDGRYYEQADQEVDPSIVEVVRVPSGVSLFKALKDDLNSADLGLFASRVPLLSLKQLELHRKVAPIDEKEFWQACGPLASPDLARIFHVDEKWTGAGTLEKLKAIGLMSGEAEFTSTLDSVSWLTNCRGYHSANQSSFYGKAIACDRELLVILPEDVQRDSVEGVTWAVARDQREFQRLVEDFCQKHKLDTVYASYSEVSASDYLLLDTVFQNVKERKDGLFRLHSLKNAAELNSLEESFKRSNKAIWNTIQWVRSEVEQGRNPSEKDLYNRTSYEYKEQGAVSQSFNTIAGVDANGSIMHYGDPKDDIVIKSESMALLDSGGYFESGFATDTTRTFMGALSVTPRPEFIEMYTLVLKGVIALESAVFPEGIHGKVIDLLARKAMYAKGQDFNHGTGHGVGIHVHEPGVRISSVSTRPMRAGQVVSIEPGLYRPGLGGVRLENIAVVEDHPDYPGMLKFRSLTWIDYEDDLIDHSLLDPSEKAYLEEYRLRCRKEGNAY